MDQPSDHDILLALGDDLAVGVWVARVPSGEVVYANRTLTEILGVQARYDARTGGFEPYNLCARDGTRYPDAKMPFVRAMTERRVVIADDLMVRRSDGRQIDLRAIARPAGNPLSHVVITFFDVSREVAAERARIESEQRLRRAQRLEGVGTLATGIAHDFNNLIFGIKLITAEVLATQPEAKVRESMELVDDITERSVSLTRALQSFTRRGKSRALPISVNDIVTSMAELLGRTLGGIDLSVELEAAERGTITGEQAQVEHLIMSLVLHARDAVHSQGRIVIRTSDRGGEPRAVVLEVQDDGVAMPDELRSRVVDPRLAPGAAPADSAAAMTALDLDDRLATVVGIAQGHGAAVEVDGGLEGQGTTMRVVFPAAARAQAARSRIVHADLPKGAGLVLVIDDDTMVRKVVASSLGSLGYKTVEASSGADAIAIYRERHAEIRAVVLDMIMPGMPCKQTYLGLRGVKVEVPVLLMSGHAHNEQVQELLDLGVRSFVTKPYSIATLAQAMVELVR